MLVDEELRNAVTAAFRFVVSLDETAIAAFTQCRLPDMEVELETVREGGLNTYVHQLPGMRKAGKMVLMNGIGLSSDLEDWYVDCMNGTYQRKVITVSLLNSKLESVMTLTINEAFPVRWSGAELQSSSNAVAIQTLEFACGEISITRE